MKYIDIKIDDDTLAVDGDGLPQMVSDLDSIVQDIKHMIRESGYLVNMIGERSSEKRQLLKQEIILLVETDERIVPGTVEMSADKPAAPGKEWVFSLTAETYEYGSTQLTLTEGIEE